MTGGDDNALTSQTTGVTVSAGNIGSNAFPFKKGAGLELWQAGALALGAALVLVLALRK